MSWIVKSIIKNKPQTDRNLQEGTFGIESDEHLDLLAVEDAIVELHKAGSINNDDLSLLRHVAQGNSLRSIVPPINMKKSMMYNRYNVVCDRIAFYLGGHFTDEGYLSYMQNKYKLTEEQLEKLKTIIMKDVVKETNNDSE